MRLVDAARPMFARHETFYPRSGWFRKAYWCAAGDHYVFSRSNAPVVIGVGKNMVRSIRFWGLAAKLLVEDPDSRNRRSPGLVLTLTGKALFGKMGWDPYMEDPGTLWLLHWLLLAPISTEVDIRRFLDVARQQTRRPPLVEIPSGIDEPPPVVAARHSAENQTSGIFMTDNRFVSELM